MRRRKAFVYGIVDKGDQNLVLIPEPEARRLAAIFSAIGARTWGEFKESMPPDDLQQVMQHFIENEDVPDDRGRFNPELLPGYCDGEWPDWAARAGGAL